MIQTVDVNLLPFLISEGNGTGMNTAIFPDYSPTMPTLLAFR